MQTLVFFITSFVTKSFFVLYFPSQQACTVTN